MVAQYRVKLTPGRNRFIVQALGDSPVDGVPAEIEVYNGTQHGWCPPDSQVYNHDQAEKAWSRLLALFNTSLT